MSWSPSLHAAKHVCSYAHWSAHTCLLCSADMPDNAHQAPGPACRKLAIIRCMHSDSEPWGITIYVGGIYVTCTCGRFAFIGSPALCYNQCTAQSGAQGVSSPNNNAEADGMASIIAHELAESVTDPQINAWCAPGTPRARSSRFPRVPVWVHILALL